MPPTFAAALIAGGRSVRMGRDKCLLPCGKGFLWEHQVAVLRKLKPAELFISCRSEQAYFDIPAVRCIPDVWPDAGPLGGIVSVMQTMKSAHLVALGVDLPRMKEAVLRELLKACGPDRGAVYQHGDLWEPLAAVYPSSLVEAGGEALARGEFALQPFLRSAINGGFMQSVPLPVKWHGCFENWNNPEELPAAT